MQNKKSAGASSRSPLRTALLLGVVLATSPVQAQEVVSSDAAAPSIEKSYAADNGITVEEAGRRLDEMREAGRLAGELRVKEGDTFGGMYVNHGSDFNIVAMFTDDPAAKLKNYKVPKSLVSALSKSSEKAIRKEQNDLVKALRDNGAEVIAQTRTKDGEIDLYTADEGALNTALAKANISLDKKVKIKKVKSTKPKGEALVYAGYLLKEGTVPKCTSGFSVVSGAGRFATTSGHCPNNMNYNGSALPFLVQYYDIYKPYDFQVHKLGTNTVSNNIYVGSTTLQKITSVMPYDQMFEGEYICKYGQTTFSTCGYVSSLNYDLLGAGPGGGFVRVHKAGTNLSDGGDSGGPWYSSRYEEAWGVHTESPNEDVNDAIFMPASRMEDFGYRVLTTP